MRGGRAAHAGSSGRPTPCIWRGMRAPCHAGGDMGVERIDVGGLPVFLAEAPAPYQAGLIFRVGGVDEPLTLRGISHLCEHLALSSLEPPEHGFNGFVTANCTHFVMQGTADEAIRYFERV